MSTNEATASPVESVVMKKVRPGFEPDKSAAALGWIGKTVECREDGGLYSERGHYGTVAEASDRPGVGGSDRFAKGEWGWFLFTDANFPDGITLHTSEVYPPSS